MFAILQILAFCLIAIMQQKTAKGKYLIFLNNDTAPFANWLSELLAPLVEDPQVGITGFNAVVCRWYFAGSWRFHF